MITAAMSPAARFRYGVDVVEGHLEELVRVVGLGDNLAKRSSPVATARPVWPY